MTAAVNITSKGQVAVPLPIRNEMNFNIGDTVFFEIKNDEVVMRKPKSLLDYEGFLGKANLPDNEEELLTPDIARQIGFDDD
jgi:AbrB family looped-hinge helix DNA binding protein